MVISASDVLVIAPRNRWNGNGAFVCTEICVGQGSAKVAHDQLPDLG